MQICHILRAEKLQKQFWDDPNTDLNPNHDHPPNL